MNAILIEEFEFLGGRRNPGFGETAILGRDAKRSLRTDDLDRQRVKEFVGKNNEGNLGTRNALSISVLRT